MKKLFDSGFAAVETVLVLVIVAIIGGTGYYVWHAKQNTDKSLNNAGNSQQAIVKAAKVTDFASCKAAKGSMLQGTFPEKCVTKDGKSFTDTQGQSAQSDGVLAPPFAGLPADLRTTIAAHATCTNSQGQLTLEDGSVDTSKQYYVANKAAFIHECQTVALYAVANGQWKFVAQTQFGFDCTTLKQYAVPTALFKSGGQGQCLDANDKFIDYRL